MRSRAQLKTQEAGSVDIDALFPGQRQSATRTPTHEPIVLQRRSALAFDGQSTIGRDVFFQMLARCQVPPGVLWWTPRVHFAIFVHRVRDLAPGLYLLARDPQALDALKRACHRDFLWEPAHSDLPFMCLARGDCRALAARLSCDQDIAADGFFSLGMLAEFDASLGHIRTGVLPQSVLGVRRRRADSLPRSGSRRRTRHGHRMLLRRSRPRGARSRRSRLPEPLSLHGRDAGRRSTSDERSRIRMGDLKWTTS